MTLRKILGRHGGVQRCRSLLPAVAAHHPNPDVVIIRENEGTGTLASSTNSFPT